MSLFSELKRRNVFRAGFAYVVLSWLLLQVTDVVVPILELPDWVAKLVLFLLGLGFPLVLFFAWAYELTPEGLKREQDVDRTRSVTRQTGRKLDRAIIVVLLIALGWFAWDRFARDGSHVGREATVSEGVTEVPAVSDESAEEVPVVAVLPFTAAGSDDGGFLAAGLHDDLLTRLAKLGIYKVISRTSMMEYTGTTKNMRQIGQELGAPYILEGGVQARGDRVRVNAQLIHAPDDEHLWAEVYDRALTTSDLFDIQAELAGAIADALHTELSPADQALMSAVPTENLAAYNAYLRGLNTYESSGYVGTQKDLEAAEAMEEAVRLDPDFALAWAGLATARIRASCCPIAPEEAEQVLAALAKARRLQPGMLESELAWAEYQYRYLNEYQQALDTLEGLGRRADGNIFALRLKTWLNRRLGRYDAGYEILKTTWRLEPRSASTYVDLIHYAWLRDDCKTAGEYLEQLLTLAREAPVARLRQAEYELECTGNYSLAAELVRGLDFSAIGGWESAFVAALSARDAELALALNNADPQDPWPEQPIWKQLNFATIYRYLQPDPESAASALDRAAGLLEAYAEDPAHEQGEQFAILQATFNALKGNPSATQDWIAEHKRRYHVESKGDVAEEAKNRFYYAMYLAEAGLHDEAIEELRIMVENPGGHRFPFVDGLPWFDPMREHPGYIALNERFGVAP